MQLYAVQNALRVGPVIAPAARTTQGLCSHAGLAQPSSFEFQQSQSRPACLHILSADRIGLYAELQLRSRCPNLSSQN